tara:strand:+ start:497 stop:682 length:186 start_codon:yes stop_codon:yes gene_type:complete
MGFGKIYETTWFGNPVENGFGGIYFDLSFGEIALSFKNRVLADGGTVESLGCVNQITNTFN